MPRYPDLWHGNEIGAHTQSGAGAGVARIPVAAHVSEVGGAHYIPEPPGDPPSVVVHTNNHIRAKPECRYLAFVNGVTVRDCSAQVVCRIHDVRPIDHTFIHQVYFTIRPCSCGCVTIGDRILE